MTEILFEVARDAHYRGCEEISGKARDLLLSWAFKAGRHQTGRGILEQSLGGLATLVLGSGDAQATSKLESAISKRLAEDNAPDQDTRASS